MFLRPAIRSLSGCSSLIRANHIAHILSPVKLAAPTSSGQIPNLVRLSSSNAEHSRTSPAEPEQIYYGTLSPKIRAVKVFSLSTSIVGLAVQPMLIEQGTKMGGVPMVVFLCGFAGLFTFVTPALLHFITKKYVTHIAYDADKDEYLANTISFFLFKKKVKIIKIVFIYYIFNSKTVFSCAAHF